MRRTDLTKNVAKTISRLIGRTHDSRAPARKALPKISGMVVPFSWAHQLQVAGAGRRAGRCSLSGLAQREKITSSAIENDTEPGTHIIPPASCWSVSAETPPG